MRTNLAPDDDLLAAAERYTGIRELSALVSEALGVIERESARRLTTLGSSELGLTAVARRKMLA